MCRNRAHKQMSRIADLPDHQSRVQHMQPKGDRMILTPTHEHSIAKESSNKRARLRWSGSAEHTSDLVGVHAGLSDDRVTAQSDTFDHAREDERARKAAR